MPWMCTMQASHSPAPQPNFVPVSYSHDPEKLGGDWRVGAYRSTFDAKFKSSSSPPWTIGV
jgi:hypothetical protein